MYEFQAEKTENKKLVRSYINKLTGTEVKTSLIYTDKEGGKWWGFMDLFRIPYMRIAYSKHISDLFTIGLSLKDILKWCEEEKNLIRSTDPEKYEKLYSMILEKERIAKHTADPIKQHIALCSVYVLSDTERVDYFDDSIAEEKMNIWNADTSMLAFFLSWHNQHIQHYTKTLEGITRTVSSLEKQRAQL